MRLASADGPHGELVLRRRGRVVELIVDGVFAMDSAEVETERALATQTLAVLGSGQASGGWQVLVGGLGLGYTATTVLADPRVERVIVAELQPALVDWAREGLLPGLDLALASGPGTAPDGVRAEFRIGDVAAIVATMATHSLDAILLDVDNGPDFLIHEANAVLYQRDFLTVAASRLRPGGVLAIWSADRSPGLADAVSAACGSCRELIMTVDREGRTVEYALYLGQ